MAKRIFSLTAVCLLGFMLLPAGNKSTQTLSAPDAPAPEPTPSVFMPDWRSASSSESKPDCAT